MSTSAPARGGESVSRGIMLGSFFHMMNSLFSLGLLQNCKPFLSAVLPALFSGRSDVDDVVGGEKIGQQNPAVALPAPAPASPFAIMRCPPAGHAETVDRDRRTPRKIRSRKTAARATPERSARRRPTRRADCPGGPSARLLSASASVRPPWPPAAYESRRQNQESGIAGTRAAVFSGDLGRRPRHGTPRPAKKAMAEHDRDRTAWQYSACRCWARSPRASQEHNPHPSI